MGRNQSLYKVQIFFDDGVGPVNPRHAEQSIDKLLDFRDEDADRLVHLLQGIHQEHILPKWRKERVSVATRTGANLEACNYIDIWILFQTKKLVVSSFLMPINITFEDGD